MARSTSPTSLKTSVSVCAAIALCLVISVAAMAQSTASAARPDRGITPGSAYSVSDIESISLSNGNLNLSIPLASLPPIAGGKLSLTLRATYNSKLWDVVSGEARYRGYTNNPIYVASAPIPGDRGGWHISAGYAIIFHNAQEDFGYVQTNQSEDLNWQQLQYQYYKAVLVSPDGAEHNLYPLNCSAGYVDASGSHNHDYLLGYCRDNPTLSGPAKGYYTADGSYISAVVSPSSTNYPQWTLYLPDGTQVVQTGDGIQRITDTNGNSIKIFSDSNGTHYQDEGTGREIKLTYNSSANNGQGQYQAWYQTVGGVWQHVDVNMKTTQVKGLIYNTTDWNPEGSENGGGTECTRQAELPLYFAQMSVVNEIVFPVTEPNQPGPRYSFSYNSDITSQVTSQVQWLCQMQVQPYTRETSAGVGELVQMVTPAGAVVNYTYADFGTETGPLEFPDPTAMARRYVSSKSVTHDNTTDTWNYQLNTNGSGGSVQNPDGSWMAETSYPHDIAYSHYFGMTGKSGLVYRTIQSGQVMTERHWTLMPFSNGQLTSPGSFTDHIPFNPVVDAEYTTLINTNGNPAKMSARTYQYDYNGNLLQTADYDWFDPSLVARDAEGVPTGVPASATVLRTTNNSYYNSAPSASSSNVYAKRQFTTGVPLILNALSETITGESHTQFSYDGQAFGTAPTVGNLTTVSSYDNAGNRWLDTNMTYDAYGNKSTVTDPAGHTTQLFYEDNTHAEPTRTVADPQNGTGQQTALTTYDYSTGLMTSQTDVNGQVSSVDYTNQLLGAVDPFGRPGAVVSPAVTVGGTVQSRRARTLYEDHARRVTTEADLFAEGDHLLKSRTTQDQLNRPVLAEQSEDGSTYTISAQTVYEQAGRITYTSNPSRAAASATDGWTRTTRDLLGRVVEVATFSGAAQPPAAGTNDNFTGKASSDYAANLTTVTDQAGKVRSSETDALGRLVKVAEDPATLNYQTSYSYDPLGNLLTVQQGTQTRTFAYDSLSRLTSATNPESGTTLYQYDVNSNLEWKTDPRLLSANNPIKTHYFYDALNRVTKREYNDGTPTVTYTYDRAGIANAKGRLTSTASSVSVTSYGGYDAMGHVTSSSQQADGQTYSMSYEYDLAGNLKREVYPSGRIVENGYDAAGRIQNVTGHKANQADTPYVSSVSYAAHGAMTSMRLGNTTPTGQQRWEHTSFNSRLQPTEIGLGSTASTSELLKLEYKYGAIVGGVLNPTRNNGNVQSQNININGTLAFTQTYEYDQLNRLQSATETGGSQSEWSQTYGYDRYGNRAVTAGYVQDSRTPTSLSVYTTGGVNRNQLTTNGYDAAGNVTSDGTGYTFGYDAENRQASYSYTYMGVTTSGSYAYDGDGRRVKKESGSGAAKSVFVYDAMGQMVAEYNNLPPASENQTSYLTSDSLGTPRVITKADGSVKARHDYLPFGEEIGGDIGGRNVIPQYGTDDGIKQKFVSKERDNETELDYVKARYYSSKQGRFTSVDPIKLSKSHLVNPQRWNQFSYVLNNPLALTDPDGRDPEGKGGGKIIDIFITISSKPGEPSLNFNTLKEIGREHGNQVNVYTVGQGGADGAASVDRAAESLTTSGRTTIIIGHSVADGAKVAAAANGGRLKGQGLEFNEGTISGSPDGKILVTQGGQVRELGQVKASNIIILSCDTGNTIRNIASNMNGQIIFNDNGPDGESDITAQLTAGYAASYVLATGGTMEQARTAAQVNVNAWSDLYCTPTRGFCNRGDYIHHETHNR